MRTPQVVKEEAKYFLDEGAKLYHIGEFNGYEVYQVGFPPDECTGYPIVFLYKEGEPVLELQYEAEMFFGVSVLEILRVAAKNTRARRKAARLAMNKEKPDGNI